VALTVPGNCSITNGSASRAATVPSGGTVTVSYTVNCVTPPGNLTAQTSTSGSSVPSSYTVAVDGGAGQSMATSGSFTFSNLAAGSHTVALTVPGNCSITNGSASRAATVPSGGTVTVSYTVNCITPNSPPVVNAGSDQTAVTGLLYSSTQSFTDANHNGPWTYRINWGDGSVSTGTRTTEGSFTVGHTYLIILPQSFTVTVTVTDAAGASGSGTKVVTVLLL
jgi:hypothetical protein